MRITLLSYKDVGLYIRYWWKYECLKFALCSDRRGPTHLNMIEMAAPSDDNNKIGHLIRYDNRAPLQGESFEDLPPSDSCREVNSTDININDTVKNDIVGTNSINTNAKNTIKNDIAGVNSINADVNDAVINDIAGTKSISTNINDLVDDYAGIDFYSIYDRNELDESFKANA